MKYQKMVEQLWKGERGTLGLFAAFAGCTLQHAKRCLVEWIKRGFVERDARGVYSATMSLLSRPQPSIR